MGTANSDGCQAVPCPLLRIIAIELAPLAIQWPTAAPSNRRRRRLISALARVCGWTRIRMYACLELRCLLT